MIRLGRPQIEIKIMITGESHRNSEMAQVATDVGGRIEWLSDESFNVVFNDIDSYEEFQRMRPSADVAE